MSILWIVVIITSLQNPTAHPGLRVWMPYDSRHACEVAEDRVDNDVVAAVAKKVMKAKHITISRVITSCEAAPPRI
jgi:hypothetical protein